MAELPLCFDTRSSGTWVLAAIVMILECVGTTRASAAYAFALREFPRAEIEFDRTTFAEDPRMADMRWER
jgi:hypothetical protein